MFSVFPGPTVLARWLRLLLVILLVHSVPGSGFAQELTGDASRILVSAEYIAQNQLEKYSDVAKKWEKDVRQLAAGNVAQSNDDGILFLGSSSIRLWKTIEQDVAPYRPIRRGYGGAKFCDLALYTPSLLRGLRFKMAVVFVANDVTGGKEDKSPEEVARLAKIVIESIRHERPDAKVLLLGVMATPSRFKSWSEIEKVNRALESLETSIQDVHFLETKSHYLDSSGNPKPELFVEDKLHQNETGYRLWGSLVVSKLDSILKN